MRSLALTCLHPSSLSCIESGKLPNHNFFINLTPFPRCHAQGSQGVPRRTGPPVAGTEHRTTEGGRTRSPPGEGGEGPTPARPRPPSRRGGQASGAAGGSSVPTSRGTEDRRCRRTRRRRRSLMESPGRRRRGRRIYQPLRLPRPPPASVRGSGTASIAPAAAAATAAAAPSPTRAAHAAGTAGRGSALRLLRSRIPPAAPSPRARPGQPLAALLRTREGPARRARVGCVYSLRTRPIRAGIGWRRAGPRGEGRGPA
ncbi:hypothetical protein ACRRTK_017366 [Alexandromys fortis]